MSVAHSTGESPEKQVPPSSDGGRATARRRLVTVLVLAVVAAGAGYYFRNVYAGILREVVANVVPIFFTPFILEATTFLVGLTMVLVWNNYHRRKDEEDEWVYLSQVEPESAMEEVPEALRRRAGETRFRESDHPELGGGASMALDRIEGSIDLGLYEEATEELLRLRETAGDSHPEVLRLRHRLCGKVKGIGEARALAADWIGRGLVDATTVEGWEL